MDRLPAVVLLAIAACDGGNAESSKPSRSRVNAVQAEATPDVDLSEFCEVWAPPDRAKPLTWPALRTAAPVAGKKRWINLWATWCKPCVAELPRVSAWHKRLAAEVDHELVFVSADAEPGDVTTFAAAHPEVEGTLQLADADGLAPWLAALGVQGGGLPAHVFVDASDRVRCVRMSEVGEDDESAVGQLLRAL